MKLDISLLFALALVWAALLFWLVPANAYENTCTGSLIQCINDPCRYVESYRYRWPSPACRQKYSSCFDSAATGPCGWAICSAGNDILAAWSGTVHVPGIGPTCPAGHIKIR